MEHSSINYWCNFPCPSIFSQMLSQKVLMWMTSLKLHLLSSPTHWLCFPYFPVVLFIFCYTGHAGSLMGTPQVQVAFNWVFYQITIFNKFWSFMNLQNYNMLVAYHFVVYFVLTTIKSDRILEDHYFAILYIIFSYLS
jgi:hypothetical protein